MKIGIIGAGGRLGAALVRKYRATDEVIGFNHTQLDLGDITNIRATLEPLRFDFLINCAAQTNVDRCESHPEEAFQVNAQAPRLLAEICRSKGAKLIHFSTDYVFDGAKMEPYKEEDAANPISVYGESKRAGEKLVLEMDDRALVVRVSWVFGPDRPSFVDMILQQAREQEEIAAVADKVSTPTYTHDIAEMLRPFLIEPDFSGILHLANAGQCSWREYAQWALDRAHAEGIPMKAKTVGALSVADMKTWVAPRPAHTVLSTEKYQGLTHSKPRDWREAVAEYVREIKF